MIVGLLLTCVETLSVCRLRDELLLSLSAEPVGIFMGRWGWLDGRGTSLAPFSSATFILARAVGKSLPSEANSTDT